MTKWRKLAIETALQKAEALCMAANGDKSTCGVFDHFTSIEETKRSIRIYVETWIIPELEKALQEKEFNR